MPETRTGIGSEFNGRFQELQERDLEGPIADLLRPVRPAVLVLPDYANQILTVRHLGITVSPPGLIEWATRALDESAQIEPGCFQILPSRETPLRFRMRLPSETHFVVFGGMTFRKDFSAHRLDSLSSTLMTCGMLIWALTRTETLNAGYLHALTDFENLKAEAVAGSISIDASGEKQPEGRDLFTHVAEKADRRHDRVSHDKREEAEWILWARRELLMPINYEIRTSMTSILGFCDILLDSLNRHDDLDAVRTIQRNGKSLLQFINDSVSKTE